MYSLSDEIRSNLIQSALDALKNSYAPYSNFNVAAAVLCDSGNIYTGVNVENASYPAGVCAETNAVSSAVSAGERSVTAVAVAGGPDGVAEDYCPPCGICRQVIREFADPENTVIIMAKSLTDYKEMTLSELLPSSFGPSNVKR